MKISERVHGFIQPVTTSIGTAATKASATVKKASKIASKILEVLFSPFTFLYNRGKSLINKMRPQSASANAQGARSYRTPLASTSASASASAPAPVAAGAEVVAAEVPPAFGYRGPSAPAANVGEFKKDQ